VYEISVILTTGRRPTTDDRPTSLDEPFWKNFGWPYLSSRLSDQLPVLCDACIVANRAYIVAKR